MKRIILVLLAILVILSIWVSLFPTSKGHKNLLKQYSKSPNPSPLINQNIIVDNPKESDSISSPLIIKGKARVFENIVSIRLLDKSDKVLAETTTYANSSDIGQFGRFQKSIIFYPTEKEGRLEVYQVSTKDGSEIDKVTVPLIFK